jgi:hypothetical protein
MKEAIFGSAGTIACLTCNATKFELPTDRSRDDLVSCRCGETLGPYLSLVAFANGEAHTPVNATIVHVSREKQLLQETAPPDITSWGRS